MTSQPAGPAEPVPPDPAAAASSASQGPQVAPASPAPPAQAPPAQAPPVQARSAQVSMPCGLSGSRTRPGGNSTSSTTAMSGAGQNERDYRALQAAVAAGRLTAQTGI
jgi:hypothetical protein